MLGNLFSTLAMKISGGLIAALMLALGIMWWRAEVWQGRAERSAQTLAEMKAAQTVALKAAQDAKERAERNYRELAERIDNDAEKARAGALASTDEYIRTHRLQCPANRSQGSGTSAAASSGDTGLPESLPANSVVVSESDVQACAGAVSYAVSAHNWAVGLGPAVAGSEP